MNNEQENMVTIPLDLFMELMEYKCDYQHIFQELDYIIDTAELNYSKTDLIFTDNTLKRFLEKFNREGYQKRYQELIKGEENEEKGNF